MTSISLCMIVRDEAERLPRCLASVRGVVDQLCVLDTGSSDGTPLVAQRLGAVVAHQAWSDDFALARNRSLAMAGGDWALVLDADEELLVPAGGPAAVRAALIEFAGRAARAIGRVRVINVDGERELSRAWIGRYFPLRAGLRFRGRIHEQLESAAGEVWRRVDCGVDVRHRGYADEALRSGRKLARNVTLLERQLAETPDDAYAWYQLGRTLAVQGEHRRAIEALEAGLALSSDADAWAPHAVEVAARSLAALGRESQALELLEQACRLAPDRADTLFLRSHLQLQAGAVESARAGFEACLALPPAGATEGWSGANSFGAAHNLGVIAECRGLLDEARRWYEQALRFEPGHAASREGLARLAGSKAGLPSAAPIG